jgi:hypothetical protein
MGAENPLHRDHLINTQWQKMVDTCYEEWPKEFVRDTELGLLLLANLKLPLSFEILRVGCLKISDAIIRIEEEKEKESEA